MPCPSIGPKWFWTIQIILVGSKSFCLGPNHFGQIQIRLFWIKCYNLDLSTRSKQIGPVQNDCYSTKIIWLVQNHFGPIEGQGISPVWMHMGNSYLISRAYILIITRQYWLDLAQDANGIRYPKRDKYLIYW